jgi:thiol-disulfide isomerase/thioredoxin
VRSDTNLSRRFQEEGVDAREYGMMPGVIDTSKKVEGKPVLRSHSFSGKESNSVFWNLGGKAFRDLSGITGLDSIADGRSFAFLDFDQDGRLDVILTNTNNPQLQVFRNQIEEAGRAIRVKLEGGNRQATASDTWSSRDGYGAHVLVEAGGRALRRELRAGDGLAAQNSDILLIGIGQVEKADKVTVLWPSGKRSEVGPVRAGDLVVIRERGGQVVMKELERLALRETGVRVRRDELGLPVDCEVNVVVTLATWCPVCRGEVAHLRRLAAEVDRVGFYAFPIDPDEGPADFKTFEEEVNPPYRILGEALGMRPEVEALMIKSFGEHPLPSTFILDRDGAILKVMKGTPTLSDLRLLTR